MGCLGDESGGTNHLQRRCILALVGGVVHGPHLVVDVFLVDIHSHCIHVAGLQQLTLVELDKGMGGVIGEENLVILDIVIQRIGLPGQGDGTVLNAGLSLEVLHGSGCLHVLNLYHSGQ